MLKIRPADPQDADQLLALGERFFEFSQFSGFVAFDSAGCKESVLSIIRDGIAYVAEIDGEIIGGILGVIVPVWFSPRHVVAAELGWWIDEQYRGGRAGVMLLRAFEGAAKVAGAVAVSMSDLSAGGTWPAGRLFEKLGYSVVERCQMKGV